MSEWLYFIAFNVFGAIYAYFIWDFHDPPICRMSPINVKRIIAESEKEEQTHN
jgi:hypothetical protein